MKTPSALTVIECNYRESFWKIDLTGEQPVIHDPIECFQHRRDVDSYKQNKTYETMGVPVEIEEIDYENYKQFRPSDGVMMNYSDLVCQGIEKGNAVLVSTGLCMYAPAIVGGIQRAVGVDKKIGVVWIDAHADNRIAEKAPTSFVGIPLSTICGQTNESWRKSACGLQIPCEGENVLASDIRICDEESLRNMENVNMVHLTSSEFKDKNAWKAAVYALAERVDAIYLSIDMDILRNEFTPAYIKSVPGGHTVEVVMNNVREVTETGKVSAVSLFCCDFDTYDRNPELGELTYQNGARIISAALEGWKGIPDK